MSKGVILAATNNKLFEGSNNNSDSEVKFVEIQNEINKIKNYIELLLHSFNHSPAIAHDADSDLTKPAVRAIDLYGHRRRRAKFFGPDLFGEPAWDILLDLFIATETGKQISVTSACIGAAVPLTTALRWLSVLEARELIVREHDDKDARRSYVRLSDLGRELMGQYLSDS